MVLDKYTRLEIVSVSFASRIDNLCKMLIKKGILTDDDLKQLNLSVEKELKELFGGINHGEIDDNDA